MPGVSGNPSGISPVLKEVVALAREKTEDAVETLHLIALDPKQPAMARVRASEVLARPRLGQAGANGCRTAP